MKVEGENETTTPRPTLSEVAVALHSRPMKHVLRTHYAVIVLSLYEDHCMFEMDVFALKKLRRHVETMGQVKRWRDSILREYKERTGAAEIYRAAPDGSATRWWTG